MKNLVIALLMLIAGVASASDGKGNEMEMTRNMLKHELESHLSFPSHGMHKDFDVVFVELAVKKDGTVEVLNMNAASEEVRRSMEEQISTIKIKAPVSEEGSFAFRVHFRMN